MPEMVAAPAAPQAPPAENPAAFAPPTAPVTLPPSPITTTSNEAASTASEDVDKATLEGTLAQLLRPMVRQWLDQNMTRALETAVRIELADGLKSGSASEKPGDKG